MFDMLELGDCILYAAVGFAILFLLGLGFYCSHGKAARFIAGYNEKSKEEREEYDEEKLCKALGKRFFYMSLIFVVGLLIDLKWLGAGLLISVILMMLAGIILLVDLNMDFDKRYKKRNLGN